jgi:hypothetical protein
LWGILAPRDLRWSDPSQGLHPQQRLGQIVRASRVADPDYTKVSAPALAFFVTYETTYIPSDADAELRARLLKRWEEYGKPFQQQRIAHFVRDMRKGEVIELA